MKDGDIVTDGRNVTDAFTSLTSSNGIEIRFSPPSTTKLTQNNEIFITELSGCRDYSLGEANVGHDSFKYT